MSVRGALCGKRPRYAAGGSLLVSYTNAKLITDVDSATAWLS
jgi:hypothetical protein